MKPNREKGIFNPNSRLQWDDDLERPLFNLASRALAGFTSVKSFIDDGLISRIEADAFEGSSVTKLELLESYDKRAAMRSFDDNAFRQTNPTISEFIVADTNGPYKFQAKIFKNLPKLRSLKINHRRTNLTCQHLKYAPRLEEVILENEKQPISHCLMCQAADTAKLCSTQSFDLSPLLRKQMVNLNDVTTLTRNNMECLQLEPGKRYSEAKFCKSAKCKAECGVASITKNIENEDGSGERSSEKMSTPSPVIKGDGSEERSSEKMSTPSPVIKGNEERTTKTKSATVPATKTSSLTPKSTDSVNEERTAKTTKAKSATVPATETSSLSPKPTYSVNEERTTKTTKAKSATVPATETSSLSPKPTYKENEERTARAKTAKKPATKTSNSSPKPTVAKTGSSTAAHALLVTAAIMLASAMQNFL